MAVRDLGAYLEPWIDYPNITSATHPDGKTYRVASPDAKTGLALSYLGNIAKFAAAGGTVAAGDLASLKLDDEGERSFYQRVLGATFDDMMTDGVPWATLEKIAQDAYLFFFVDEKSANLALAGQGKAMTTATPNRATRRAAAKKAGPKSAQDSGGSANRTPSRASTGSTTRANGSAPAKKAGANRA